MLWRFLTKRTEKIAEVAAEKSLKKFQSHHQKQIDAIHETYQVFQQLISIIRSTKKPEKFTPSLKGTEKLDYLIEFRHSFKRTYKQNKLIFPEYICEKIEKILPVVDKYIETYESGLWPEPQPEEQQQYDENNGGLYITGMWNPNAFEGQLEQLEEILKDIEKEFRKIYGTSM